MEKRINTVFILSLIYGLPCSLLEYYGYMEIAMLALLAFVLHIGFLTYRVYSPGTIESSKKRSQDQGHPTREKCEYRVVVRIKGHHRNYCCK